MNISKVLRRLIWELIGVGVIFSGLFPIIDWLLPQGYWGELISHIIVVLTAIAVTTMIVVWKHRDIIDAVVRAREHHHIEPAGPLDSMFRMSVDVAVNRLSLLKSKEGVAVKDNEELNVIVNSCFRLRFRSYLAIDSHPPSEYYQLYPQYLSDHKVGLKPGIFSWRLLAVEQTTLIHDYQKNKALFEQFVQWHTDNGVILGQVTPQKAKEYAALQHLPTTDLGLWREKYSILFFPSDSASDLKLRYLDPNDTLYNGCKLYFRNLASEDSTIVISQYGIKFEPRDANQRRDALGLI